MNRRNLLSLFGGVAMLPVAASAQQAGRFRRVGMLFFGAENDTSTLARAAAFKDEFKRLGWIEGRNVTIDVRFAAGEPDKFRAYANELVSLSPDLMVPQSGASTRAVQDQTKTIPIVFVEVGDPTANGLVQSVAHPEGNSTGFSVLYPSIGGKWLELLREAAPHITRVMLLINTGQGGLSSAGNQYLPALEAAAATYGLEAHRFSYSNALDLEHTVGEFAVAPNVGAIVVPPTPTESEQEVIKRALIRHRVVAVYQYKLAIETGGGLISYGPDTFDLFRGAASYADRILRGAKPADLPVQFPTKFELVVNLRTAKALGLTVPASLLNRADEVIE
jgi:putative tryptophan/tyrosine transport system substrate-binding protein